MTKGIPTKYRGIQFRSRAEARWAAMFDELGWGWQYEPYDLDGWIPDFSLNFEHPTLVEVKGGTQDAGEAAEWALEKVEANCGIRTRKEFGCEFSALVLPANPSWHLGMLYSRSIELPMIDPWHREFLRRTGKPWLRTTDVVTEISGVLDLWETAYPLACEKCGLSMGTLCAKPLCWRCGVHIPADFVRAMMFKVNSLVNERWVRAMNATQWKGEEAVL